MTEKKQVELEDIDILGDAHRLSLKPDDTVVLMTEMPVSSQTAERMIIQVRNALRDPDRKVLIIDSGIKIGILGKE
jgi:hypothetical protein